MIAHRLQTIETADQLLYLEQSDKVVACQKGTEKYDEVMKKLKQTNYAHQKDDNKNEEVDQEKQNPVLQKTTSLVNSERTVDAKQGDSHKVASVDERRQSARGDGWCRILSYYHPKIFAILMVITAGIQAMAFPSLGFIVAKV